MRLIKIPALALRGSANADSSQSSTYQTSQLTLTLNAASHGQLSLSYKVRNVGDETDTTDGVFISGNGTTWTKVDS